MSSGEYPFLRDLFACLKADSVTYCVLRNHEALPYDTNGSDIDVFVDAKDFTTFHRILKEQAAKYHGRIISVLVAPNIKTLAVLGCFNDIWWGVRFDTFTYIGTNDCRVFTNEFFRKRIELQNGIQVARTDDAAILGLIKEIIGARLYNERYSDDAVRFFKKNSEIYTREFLNVLPKTTVDTVLAPLLTESIAFSEGAAKAIFSGYRKKRFTTKPLKFICELFLSYFCKLKRLMHRPGFSVAFLGVAPAEFESLMEVIAKPLENALHTKLLISDMHPNKLSELNEYHGADRASDEFLSIAHIIRSGVRHFVGYWKSVHLSLAKNLNIWFFNGYYYDYHRTSNRSRFSVSDCFLKLRKFLIPLPDLIICFENKRNLNVNIMPKEQESCVDERAKRLRSFCDNEKRAVWIDAQESFEETTSQILEAISCKMASRYKS